MNVIPLLVLHVGILSTRIIIASYTFLTFFLPTLSQLCRYSVNENRNLRASNTKHGDLCTWCVAACTIAASRSLFQCRVSPLALAVCHNF